MLHTLHRRWLVLTALAALTLSNGIISAAEPAKGDAASSDGVVLPKPAEIQTLAVNPAKIALKGGDDAQQLILTATLVNGGKLQDLTGDCKYEVADTKVVRVTTGGRVIPLANGTTEVTVTFGDKVVKVPVSAELLDQNLPINFGNQITPIFTKLGCNSGGCHGKASGQNGFKLSLLGFEPDVDYNALVKEARGRRLFPAAPEHSLLLLKATGIMAHAGGKRMEVGSDEYKLVRRWIAAGMPFGKESDPTVTKITMYPDQRVMTRQNKQQFAVYAHYSDGSIEDITRRAQYDSNDTEIAVVDTQGTVRTLDMSGEAAIMARYQGHVNTFRATVPLGVKVPEYKFEVKTSVDTHTLKKWQTLGLVPAELCNDETFIRRVYLDVMGTLPTPEQVKKFLADNDPTKRDKLIDALVETPEYSYYFAAKWADILRVKRGGNNNDGASRAKGTFGFHNWIREAVASDKPYDEFAREIIAATGDEINNPPSVWYKELTKDQAKFQPEFVDNVAQVFMGLRLSCANCHHHPYEKWSQDDYWGIASFVGRTSFKNITLPGLSAQNNARQRQFIYTRSGADPTILIPRTTRKAVMHVLDGPPMTVSSDEDPRQKLVDWLVDTKNPFFARSVANRYWAHFFGRGIVDPIDDMRVTNPPTNPELLDALAKELTDNKYSLKHLVKVICKSRTYQLSSVPNEFNKQDKQAYARYYPKRMSAEVLFDAVCNVTNSPTLFAGLPQDKHAPKRAIMLPDESFASYFLDVFGRPQRISSCECERVSEANLAQALHLLNSDEVNNKLSAANGRADLLAKDARPDGEKVEELFLWAFARKPTENDMKVALAHIEKHAKDKKIAYQDLLWSLINSKEFVFNK
ncbi:MAG: DUF1553 domain-containing protein [Gemmataceae bacterium]|nr:DUF1553 domain-containing protein [Gemmataceae bacterium]